MRTKVVYVIKSCGGSEINFSHPDAVKVEMTYVMCQAVAPFRQKITTVKMVRSMLGIGLKEAKYFVDDAWENA